MRTGRHLDFRLENSELEDYQTSLEELVSEEVNGRKENVYNQINDYLDEGIQSNEDLEEFLNGLSGHSIGAAGRKVTLHNSERSMAKDVFESAYRKLD